MRRLKPMLYLALSSIDTKMARRLSSDGRLPRALALFLQLQAGKTLVLGRKFKITAIGIEP